MRHLHKKAGMSTFERELCIKQIEQERNGYGILASAVEKRIQERNKKWGKLGVKSFEFDVDKYFLDLCVGATDLFAEIGNSDKVKFYFGMAEELVYSLWTKGIRKGGVCVAKRDFSEVILSGRKLHETVRDYKTKLEKMAESYKLPKKFLNMVNPLTRQDELTALNIYISRTKRI